MKNSSEVSMDFFRKIQQFFMSDFLHSKFPKMRWICGMSRADFRNLVKILVIRTVGKIDTFESVWNFIILQWQKYCYFLSTFFFPSSLRKQKSMMIYNSMIQIQFSQICFSRRYSSSQYLLHVTKKSLSAHVLRGWTFCVILQKHWISCKIWLMS